MGQQEEVVEEEAVELLVALGLVELPAVQKFARPQAVSHRVEHQLLEEASRQEEGGMKGGPALVFVSLSQSMNAGPQQP